MYCKGLGDFSGPLHFTGKIEAAQLLVSDRSYKPELDYYLILNPSPKREGDKTAVQVINRIIRISLYPEGRRMG